MQRGGARRRHAPSLSIARALSARQAGMPPAGRPRTRAPACVPPGAPPLTHLGLEVEGGEVGAAARGPKQRKRPGAGALALRSGGSGGRRSRRGVRRARVCRLAARLRLCGPAGSTAGRSAASPARALTKWNRLLARLDRTAGGSIALARASTPQGMPAAAGRRPRGMSTQVPAGAGRPAAAGTRWLAAPTPPRATQQHPPGASRGYPWAA